MATTGHLPSELTETCLYWSETLATLGSVDEKINFFRYELPAFVLDRPLLRNILHAVSNGDGFPDRRQGMLFDNELLLYMDDRRRFSMRMYLYEPGEYTPIHDHSAWGVMGSACGKIEITKYRREDDGLRDGYASIQPAGRLMCPSGSTDFTLPLDEGIHRVGNPTDELIVVICVYGTPARRLYINHFDPDRRRVVKVYPPRLKKKRLAVEALKVIPRK